MKDEESTFRDKLALERTYLAKERTVLAYVRTGLALIGVAAFNYKFIDMGYGIKIAVTILLVVPGVYATLLGLYKTIKYRTERKQFVKAYRGSK